MSILLISEPSMAISFSACGRTWETPQLEGCSFLCRVRGTSNSASEYFSDVAENQISKDTVMRSSAAVFLPCALVMVGSIAAQEQPPAEWVDPSTGHRIVRLSDEPGSASLYFHQNAYTADGDSMVFTTPEGLSLIDLKTRKIRRLVEGHADHVVVGRKTRQVFYM